MNEKTFLISLALTKFCSQYNTVLNVGDFEIKTIPLNYNSILAYEIFSRAINTYTRLRIYLNVGSVDTLGPYSLEVDSSDHVGELGDEVFVTNGIIDEARIKSNTYPFNYFFNGLDNENVLITEDSFAFITEDNNNYFALETA